MSTLPRILAPATADAVLRSCPEDFQVQEELGFAPDGEGEHALLYLQKRELNTQDLLQRIAKLSGIPPRDIGVSGLKDRNAVTRQWFSVRMAGRPEPVWQNLSAAGDVTVLEVTRHQKKLKRGVHRANRFSLLLRDLVGDRAELTERLQQLKNSGVPNYFGEQRFGRGGANLREGQRWIDGGGRKLSRQRRSLYLSAMRAQLFNQLLAARVANGSWNQVLDGDVCMLQGSHSLFVCEQADAEMQQRALSGDVHPALPMWGNGRLRAGAARAQEQHELLSPSAGVCEFLEKQGLSLAYRAGRVLLDDFCWRFCDDGLQLDFLLPAGSYATAVLAELVNYREGNRESGGSE